MRDLMQQDLEVISRPFGEFIPGANTAEPGQIDKQIAIVKQLEIKGKTVAVPRSLESDPGDSNDSGSDNKAMRKAKREARKKADGENKPNT